MGKLQVKAAASLPRPVETALAPRPPQLKLSGAPANLHLFNSLAFTWSSRKRFPSTRLRFLRMDVGCAPQRRTARASFAVDALLLVLTPKARPSRSSNTTMFSPDFSTTEQPRRVFHIASTKSHLCSKNAVSFCNAQQHDFPNVPGIALSSGTHAEPSHKPRMKMSRGEDKASNLPARAQAPSALSCAVSGGSCSYVHVFCVMLKSGRHDAFKAGAVQAAELFLSKRSSLCSTTTVSLPWLRLPLK